MGAMTFCKVTLSITSLSLMTISITLNDTHQHSEKGGILHLILCLVLQCSHYTECCYAKCHGATKRQKIFLRNNKDKTF